MMSAKVTTPSGTLSQAMGGEMLGSLAEILVQVCFFGMRFFSLKTGLVKTMLSSNCCCTETAAAGGAPSSTLASAGAAASSPPPEHAEMATTSPAMRAVRMRAMATLLDSPGPECVECGLSLPDSENTVGTPGHDLCGSAAA